MPTKPSVMRPNPPRTQLRTPNRATIFGLRGDTMIITIADGRVRTALPSAEYPCTNCRYWEIRKNVPNMQKNASVMARLPMPNPRSLKRRGSSIG